MAGDWIKMRGNLWDDPRVSRICDMTDQGEAAVIGGLYWLWATADQHTESGFMPGLTLRQIDRKTGVTGLAAALVAIGWIKEEPQGVLICNFEEHNGASAKKRCQTAKRVANHRYGNDEVTQPALQETPDSVSGALAREEKRREEKKDSEANASGGKPPPPTHEEIIFSYGLSLLTSAGSTDKAARSFLGGLRKGRDDADVVNALRDCIRAKPLQPIEWLAAALPPAGARSKPNAQEVLEAQNREVGRRFLEKESMNAPQ